MIVEKYENKLASDSINLQDGYVDVGMIGDSFALHEKRLLEYLSGIGLPVDDVFVPIEERKRVILNVENALSRLIDEKEDARYISKFLAASVAGLFDAALNYLWDETIYQLRKRVANYDIEYFYDVAVVSDKRKNLSGAEDLCKLDDSELIIGAKRIDIISDVGYRQLDYIKYMRNWASAAHPNQTNITGLQLVSWLETCIREVISLPDSNITVETGRFLKNLKENEFSRKEIISFESFVRNMTGEKVDNLVAGLFGIYYRGDTEEFARKNVRLVFPFVWEQSSEVIKNECGIKYARLSVNGDIIGARKAKELLEFVKGLEYLPDEIRAAELSYALEQLKEAHEGMNNFYREPMFANQLLRIVGDKEIPRQIYSKFVYVVIDCFITNGNGVCWDADELYKELIDKFNQEQIEIASLMILDERISSMLQFELCSKKYLELITLLSERNTSRVVDELFELIEKSGIRLDLIRRDTSITRKIDVLKQMMY